MDLSSLQDEYREVSKACRDFAVALLDECRTSDEVQLLLKQDHDAELGTTPGGRYPRLRLAVNYKQKEVLLPQSICFSYPALYSCPC